MTRGPRTTAREPGRSPNSALEGVHAGRVRLVRHLAFMAGRIVSLSCLLIAGATPDVHALPGDLDGSFGGFGGLGATTWVGQNVMCHAVAPDGKIVLAGTSGTAIVVSRRLPDGDPDPSFGGDGSILLSSLYPMVGRSVAVQSDGRIVVAGFVDSSPSDFLVVRITASGVADASFGGDGFVTADLSVNGTDIAEKVLIQPDGKIVAVGSAFLAGDWDFAVARFNSDGTLDASFSGDGKATVGFGGDDQCFDAALQADGKLIMVGSTEGLVLHDEDFALARLHVDGSLDDSFDDDGKVQTGFGDFYDRAYAVAIQPSDLRIVVVGRAHLAPGTGRAARYYSSDGSLDDSFDGDGKMDLPLIAHDAVVNTAGKITLVGIDPANVALALRLNANGSPDTEWLGDGDVILDNDINERPSLSVLTDGRVLTVLPQGTDCRIMRWWADGFPDTGGAQTAAFADATFPPGSHEIAHDVAVLPDGRILLAGEVSTPGYTETDFALMRFQSDGRLDLSFGVHGRAALSLGNFDVARAMAVQPDGKIVLAGHTGSGNAVNFMIARFHANGTLDNTFGFGGFNALDFMGGPDYGWALALQPDGKILVAGTVFNGARNVFGVARFDPDGTIDHTFDVDGKQLVEFSVGPTHWASAVLVQASGRIVVGGHVGADFALVGLTPTGGVDPNFGVSGRTTKNLGGDDYLEALVMGTDGRIYAAGSRFIGGNGDWAIARWTASAGLFPCLPVCPWTSGFVDFGATSGWAEALDVRGDGNMVVAGTMGNVAHWAQFTPSSPTPVASGSVAFPGNTTNALAVRFAGANRVVLAGTHGFQGDHNMTLAKFEAVPNTTVSVDEFTPAAPSLRLAAPYPNPLVNRSTIAFELPRAQSVRLAIHDVSGRQVRVLQDGDLAAGSHHRLWDGTDDQGRAVAAGVYFARLVAGADHAAASLVVIR